MKSALPLAATVLLHAALVGVVVTGLSSNPKPDILPPPIAITLLPPQASTPPAPLPVVPAPSQPPQKKRQESKPRIEPKPAPRETAAPIAQVPDAAFEFKPSASSTTAVPAPAVATLPAAPARTPVSIPASYAASNRTPAYPSLSLRLEEQGKVELRVLVKADGTAGEVEIRSSSGYPLLDASARAAVRNWRFNPATSDGKPISEWFIVPVTFKLPN